MQPKQKRPRFHQRSDKGGSHQAPEAPRSDKGGSHQAPEAPRSDKGGSHQTSESDVSRFKKSRSDNGGSQPQSSTVDLLQLQFERPPRSDKGATHQTPEAPRSDKGTTHQTPEAPRSDKGGIHRTFTTLLREGSKTAAQLYGEKYQSELRFLTCACCAFEGPRSGFRLLADLNARGCLSWHRHTKHMIVEGLTNSDSKYDRKYATILRDGLDEFGMIPQCKVNWF
jgi:hypothetical protein